MKSTILLSTLLLACGLCQAQPAAPKAPPVKVAPAAEKKNIDEKARGIMNAAETFFRSAKTLQVDAAFSVDISGPRKVNQKVVQRISLRKPDALSMVTIDNTTDSPLDAWYAKGTGTLQLGDQAVIVVKDIKSTSEFFKSEKLGYNKQMKTNMLMDQNMPAALIRNLAVPGMEKWDENLVALAYVGEEELDGKKAHHLVITDESFIMGQKQQVDIDLWIQSGDQPLLLKVAPNMQKVMARMAAQNPQAAGMKFQMTGTYANWTIGGALTEKTFTAPAAGKIPVFASFMEFIQAMQAKQAGGGSPATELVGSDAADFELALLDGKRFKLSDQKNKKVVILDFWATWCGPCVRALPDLMKAAKDYADKGVVLVGVNQQEKPRRIEDFLADKKWDLTVALDAEGAVGRAYRVRGIPQTVIVGKDGKIKQVHVGFAPGLEAKIKAELDEILAE